MNRQPRTLNRNAEHEPGTRNQERGTASIPSPRTLGVKAKFWLTIGPRTLFGDGKADLLEAVDRLGSLHRAAKSMDMSYRHAWGLLRELDKAAGFKFLDHSGHGPRTRLRLTDDGRRFIDAYRRFRAPLTELVEARFARVFRDGASRRTRAARRR